MKRAPLLTLVFGLIAAGATAQNDRVPFGSKFFQDLRTLFGGLERSELERAFQQSKAIECSDLSGQAGEWKQVAFLNDNRSLGNWHYDTIEDVKRDLVKFVFSGICDGKTGGLKVATTYPIVESVKSFRDGNIPFSEIVVRNNNPVGVTFNRAAQAYTFELPYLYLVHDGLASPTYSLQPPRLTSKPERSVKAQFSCKALSGPELTYRFLLCRGNVFANRAYYILSDGKEARSEVRLTFGDAASLPAINAEAERAVANGRPAPQKADPTALAVQYLSREVPSWSRDNGCFSCHNNGDGARALYLAKSMSFSVPDSSLRDTTEWLKKPEAWDNNKGDAGFSDKRLARIEFAGALVAAFDAGIITDKAVVQSAVESLLVSQDAGGAWTVDTESIVAAPARYGPVLATYMARQVLQRGAESSVSAAIERADGFLLHAPIANVMNAAAIVMAFAKATRAEETARATEALDFITGAQASDGGWGPYPKSPTEVFDTAIAVLALADVKDRAGIGERIRRGREYLISMQLPDGGWIETTRPAGGRSYAEHISTCGWATTALLITSQ